jgi:hypothetical protein
MPFPTSMPMDGAGFLPYMGGPPPGGDFNAAAFSFYNSAGGAPALGLLQGCPAWQLLGCCAGTALAGGPAAATARQQAGAGRLAAAALSPIALITCRCRPAGPRPPGELAPGAPPGWGGYMDPATFQPHMHPHVDWAAQQAAAQHGGWPQLGAGWSPAAPSLPACPSAAFLSAVLLPELNSIPHPRHPTHPAQRSCLATLQARPRHCTSRSPPSRSPSSWRSRRTWTTSWACWA